MKVMLQRIRDGALAARNFFGGVSGFVLTSAFLYTAMSTAIVSAVVVSAAIAIVVLVMGAPLLALFAFSIVIGLVLTGIAKLLGG